MKLRILCFALLLTRFVVNGQSKIGTIDSEFIVNVMPKTEKVMEKLNAYAIKLDSSYQIKLAEYKDKVEAFKKIDPSLSDTFKQLKIDEIQELEVSLQKDQQNGTQLVQIKKNELMSPIYQYLTEVIQELAKDEGYTQVLTTSGNEFAYIDPLYDLTEKIIAKLGIKLPEPKKE